MSDFGQSPKLKHIRETQRFYKNLWKATGLFSPNNRTFRTFQSPDSQTWGSGYNSNTKPNTAIKNSKNRFQKCPKNHNQGVLEFVSESFEIFPSKLKKFENFLKLPVLLFSISLIIYSLFPIMVGDAGLEPTTPTMSM